jgi:hypothetical protein
MREMPELLCFLGLSRVLQGNAGVLPWLGLQTLPSKDFDLAFSSPRFDIRGLRSEMISVSEHQLQKITVIKYVYVLILRLSYWTENIYYQMLLRRVMLSCELLLRFYKEIHTYCRCKFLLANIPSARLFPSRFKRVRKTLFL